MLTSSALTSSLPFRGEFRLDTLTADTDYRFLDMSIQPIDAPERIAAGSHVSVKAITRDTEYGLPNAVDRVKS